MKYLIMSLVLASMMSGCNRHGALAERAGLAPARRQDGFDRDDGPTLKGKVFDHGVVGVAQRCVARYHPFFFSFYDRVDTYAFLWHNTLAFVRVAQLVRA